MKKLLPIKLKFLSALAFLLLSSVAFGQNLVQNGSFENSTPTAWNSNAYLAFTTLSSTSTLANWTYVGGDVNVHHYTHHNMGCPGADTQHIDLNTNGIIQQKILGLTPGVNYTLTFFTSVHKNLIGCGATTSQAAFGTIQLIRYLDSVTDLSVSMRIPKTDTGVWKQRTYAFIATADSLILRFKGDSSCYHSGGILVDSVVIRSVCNPDCEEEEDTTVVCHTECQDHDWYAVGTTSAPMSPTDKIFRIQNAGIGTNNPVWNFKLTVDNRDDIFQQNNNRNAIHATAMHTNCSYGYGILVNTNPLAGTKAFAAQGNGIDRAVIYGNGKSWFSNVMTLGGNPPEDACDDLPSIHILTINGTGLINGMNLTSDSRFKTDVKPIEKTDEIISKLNPVVYKFKTEEFKNRNFPEGNTYGFIAQELKEVLPYTVTEETDGYLSVNYIAIIPVLTQAIKEQQEKIVKLEEKVAVMEGINKQQGTLEGSPEPQKVEINKTAMLMQNNPNPLSDVTFIDYYLPSTTVSAFIKVTDNNGRLIQAFPIEKTGYGQLELNCLNMATGTYYYSLIVDNNVIATKTMLIAKN